VLRNALIAIYILVVLAISAVARASVLPDQAQQEINTTDLQKFNYKKHVGTIVALGDGSLALVIDQSRAYSLKSRMDLTNYIGSKVVISGIELDQQLAPNLGVEVVDPLPNFNTGTNLVTFFVFGINEVTQ
jgi:hypothetical protein